MDVGAATDVVLRPDASVLLRMTVSRIVVDGERVDVEPARRRPAGRGR
ncbi:hypothetical protein [Pseudonocardia sp. 73-21]|nr:hypothetical protein [Pseudonocardia sp. 73-21]